MKISTKTILMVAAMVVGSIAAMAQTVKIKPNINYSASPSQYVLGGFVVDGVKDFDTSAAGLSAGASARAGTAQKLSIMHRSRKTESVFFMICLSLKKI